MGTSGRAVLRRYRDEELRVILDFLRRGQQLQDQEARRIRALEPDHLGGAGGG